MMAVLLLLVLMFGIAVLRVYLPIPAKTEGQLMAKITLGLRERMLVQRTNLYLLGAVILIGAIGGFISGPIEMVALLAVFALLLIPCRYAFTTHGIAFNNVVFRSWADFTGYREERNGLVLQAVEGQRDFRLRVLGVHRAAAISAIERELSRPGERCAARKPRVVNRMAAKA